MVRKNMKQLKWKQKQKKIRKQCNDIKMKYLEQQQINKDIHQHYQHQQNNLILTNQDKISQKCQQKHQQSDNKQNIMIQVNHSSPQPQPIQPHLQPQPEPQPQHQLQPESPQPKNITQQLHTLLTSSQIYQRQPQITTLKQFLHSPTQYLLYISGISGTGKTSTITTILTLQNIKYELINCISQNNQQLVCRNLVNVCTRWNNATSEDLISTVVIDQCDYLTDFRKVVHTIRHNTPNKTKIILICNSSCISQIKLTEPITTLFFLPYTQQQLITIANNKCKQLFINVPKQIVIEAAKRATRCSGDFREMQKYIVNWVEGQCEDQSLRGKLVDQSIRILGSCVQRFPYKKKQILMTVLQLDNNIQQTHRRRRRKCKTTITDCICRQNILKTILQKFQKCTGNNICLMYLKQLQQVGILAFSRKRCGYHYNQITNITFGYKINKDLIRDLIRKFMYSVPSF